LNKEKLIKVAQALQGKIIKQLTPTRVAHRRANKVRERTIYNCTIESVEGIRAILTLETESGTYIKEFISGDENQEPERDREARGSYRRPSIGPNSTAAS
jgi:tRNA pseudouridine synthase 10